MTFKEIPAIHEGFGISTEADTISFMAAKCVAYRGVGLQVPYDMAAEILAEQIEKLIPVAAAIRAELASRQQNTDLTDGERSAAA